MVCEECNKLRAELKKLHEYCDDLEKQLDEAKQEVADGLTGLKLKVIRAVEAL